MVSEIRNFCNDFVEKYPKTKKKNERLDLDIVEKRAQDVLNYLNGGEISSWDLFDIDIKKFKEIDKSKHSGLGLIIFKNQDKILLVCSGGYNARSYIEKIEQEVSNRPGDNARTLFNRLKGDGIKNPLSFIRSCECIVLKPHPHEEISGAEMTVIVPVIYTFNEVKYKLLGNYRIIVADHRKKKGWV